MTTAEQRRATATHPFVSATRWVGPLAIWGLAAALLLLLGAAFYPGQTSIDSDSLLHQIGTGRLNDWHPPGLTRLWQGLLMVWPARAPSGPLFVFNAACWFAGFALIAVSQVRDARRGTALACMAVAALPLSLMLLSRITKDANLAGVLVLAVGLLLTARRRPAGAGRAALLAIAALALIYALHVRHNAVFIVGPLLAMLVAWFRPALARRPVVLVGCSLVLSVLLIPLVSFDNHRLLGAADAQPINSLRLFDLAGIAHRTGDVTVFPPGSTVDRAEVERCYTPAFWDALAPWGQCGDFASRAGVRFADQTGDVLLRFDGRPLAAAWTMAIRRHPVGYAAHRLDHFDRATYAFGPLGAAVGFASVEDHVHGRYRGSRLLYLLRYGAPFTPAWQIVLGLVMAPFLVLVARRGASTAGDVALYLCAGGLAYAGSFLIVGVATDPRYFLVSSALTVSAAVLALGDPAFRAELALHRRLAVAGLVVLVAMAVAQTASRYAAAPEQQVALLTAPLFSAG